MQVTLSLERSPVPAASSRRRDESSFRLGGADTPASPPRGERCQQRARAGWGVYQFMLEPSNGPNLVVGNRKVTFSLMPHTSAAPLRSPSGV
jgi:hypothetical protein